MPHFWKESYCQVQLRKLRAYQEAVFGAPSRRCRQVLRALTQQAQELEVMSNKAFSKL